jgi:hypothetical protein
MRVLDFSWIWTDEAETAYLMDLANIGYDKTTEYKEG